MNRRSPGVQSLKSGAVAQMLPIIVGYGTVLLTTPFVVGQLGLHDFGIWSMTGAVAQYAALLDLGVSRAASRNVAVFHAKGEVKNEGAVVGICLAVLAVLGVGLMGVAFAIYEHTDRFLRIDNPRLTLLLLLCSFSVVTIGMFARVIAAASIGRGRQVHANIGLATLSTLQALGGVAALLVWDSLAAFAIGTASGTLAGLIAVVAAILVDERRIVIGVPRFELFRQILTFGLNSQIAAAGSILLLQSGKLIAGVLLGPTAAGIYELASRLAMGAQVIGAAIPGALMPHLARSHLEGGFESLRNQYKHLTQRNAAVALFVPFGMAATAFSAIPFWLDKVDFHVVIVLIALLPGIATNVSTGVCTSLLSAVDRTELLARMAIVGGLLQVGLAIVSGYLLGFPGLALSYAIGVPLINLASMLYTHSRIDFPIRLFAAGIAGPLLVGATALAAVLPIGLISQPDNREAALWPFIVSVLIFCVIYGSLGWKLKYLPKVSTSLLPGRAKLRGSQRNS